MARVLPQRRKRVPVRRRKEGPTAMQQAIQGINLAGGITRLAGGLGELFYPGGIPGAITDASRGEATGEELLGAQQDLMRNRMRRSVASGGIVQGPDGKPMPRPPARQMPFAQDPGVEAMAAPRGAGLLNRMTQRGVEMGQPQPKMQPLVDAGAMAQRVGRQVGDIGRQVSDSAQAPSPALSKPEPSTEAPVVTTLEKFKRAAQAAKDAGSLEEFKRWSATAFTKGALNIEDLTDLQKLSLERTLGAQMGEIEAAGNRPVADAPSSFGDVYSQIVSASTPEEVDDLVGFASSIQPKRGIVASRTHGDKTREMERIEEAAWRRKLQLEKGEFPEVDLKGLAGLGIAEGRSDLYKPKPVATGPSKPSTKTGYKRIKALYLAAVSRLQPKDRSAEVEKNSRANIALEEKIEGFEANEFAAKGISGAKARAMINQARSRLDAARRWSNEAMGKSVESSTGGKFLDFGLGDLMAGRDFVINPLDRTTMRAWETFLSGRDSRLSELSRQAAGADKAMSGIAAARKQTGILDKRASTLRASADLSPRQKAIYAEMDAWLGEMSGKSSRHRIEKEDAAKYMALVRELEQMARSRNVSGKR